MIEIADFETRLHHVGFAIRNIENEIAAFRSSILARWDGKIFHDPLQKVRVTFLRTPSPTDAMVELVESAAEDSPVGQFLKRGGGLHHLCYEVPDLDAHLEKMKAGGGIIIKSPLPAVAFENRRIAWVVTRQKLLLEFLEKKKP